MVFCSRIVLCLFALSSYYSTLMILSVTPFFAKLSALTVFCNFIMDTGKFFSEARNIWRTCCLPKLFWMSKQNKNLGLLYFHYSSNKYWQCQSLYDCSAHLWLNIYLCDLWQRLHRIRPLGTLTFWLVSWLASWLPWLY